MNLQFVLFAALLIVTVAVIVLPPLWFGARSKAGGADRKAANLAIFRDQLAELEREQAAGTLAAADFATAREELQRRLIEEVDVDASVANPTSGGRSRSAAIVVFLVLGLGSLGGYALLGNPAALDPAATAPQKQMTAQDIEGMVERLAERMRNNPDDLQGWLMLGRSYKMMRRFDEAVAAYAKAESVIEKDPELLASYAETLALASGKGFAGKPASLIEKALKLDPKHAHSLFLGGAAAMESGDRKTAIARWEALLPQVEAGSELDQMLRGGLEQLKQGK